MEQLLCLFELRFDDPADMRPAIAGRPVYLAMAMDSENHLKLKPQNLLLNLPLKPGLNTTLSSDDTGNFAAPHKSRKIRHTIRALSSEKNKTMSSHASQDAKAHSGKNLAALALGAVGVVYGDIGTSPSTQ